MFVNEKGKRAGWLTGCVCTYLNSQNFLLAMGKLQLTGHNRGRVFNSRSGRMYGPHLIGTVAIRPNLELKLSPNYFYFISC